MFCAVSANYNSICQSVVNFYHFLSVNFLFDRVELLCFYSAAVQSVQQQVEHAHTHFGGHVARLSRAEKTTDTYEGRRT